MSHRISGYIIAVPVSPWDKKDADKIQLDMGLGSISRTARGAWEKWVRQGIHIPPADVSIKIQQWSDRGYRPRKVTITLEDDD